MQLVCMPHVPQPKMTAAKCEANDMAETFQAAAKSDKGEGEKVGRESCECSNSNSLLHATGDRSLETAASVASVAAAAVGHAICMLLRLRFAQLLL